ncbi:type II toxin-antitoxin system HicA family toxin [Verrucomicrobiota bacterium]
MKRLDLIHQIEKNGCVFIRHGGRHDWYQNPRTGACQPVARHREIKDHLAKHILRKLAD